MNVNLNRTVAGRNDVVAANDSHRPSGRVISSDDGVGVYAIQCKDCDSFYFGETGRGRRIRIEEHKKAVREYSRNSAIAKHCWEEDHVMDWKGAKAVY